jgi:hypothetical protein
MLFLIDTTEIINVMITHRSASKIIELMDEICLYAHSSKRKEGCENVTCCMCEISD